MMALAAAALLLSTMAGQGHAHKPPSARQQHLRAQAADPSPPTPAVAALVSALVELRSAGALVGGDGSLLAGPEVLAHLKDLVAPLGAADFGVSAQTIADKAAADPNGGKGAWYYQAVHADDNVSVGVFLLPASSVIPLHDHPGMHVLGRLLFGRVRVAQMDLEKPHTKLASGLTVPSLLRSNRVHGPEPEPLLVTPDFGNLHELEALDHAAFLDVIFPPYGPGRDCSFFEAPLQTGGGAHLLKVN